MHAFKWSWQRKPKFVFRFKPKQVNVTFGVICEDEEKNKVGFDIVPFTFTRRPALWYARALLRANLARKFPPSIPSQPKRMFVQYSTDRRFNGMKLGRTASKV